MKNAKALGIWTGVVALTLAAVATSITFGKKVIKSRQQKTDIIGSVEKDCQGLPRLLAHDEPM